jgi:hypothetical protein
MCGPAFCRRFFFDTCGIILVCAIYRRMRRMWLWRVGAVAVFAVLLVPVAILHGLAGDTMVSLWSAWVSGFSVAAAVNMWSELRGFYV